MASAAKCSRFLTWCVFASSTIAIFADTPTNNSVVVPTDCGETITEAASHGCSFDVLTHYWYPPQCSELQTSEEFRQWEFSTNRLDGPFPYYSDPEGTKPISSMEEMSTMNGKVYTTLEGHLAHCIFLLRRLHRAVEEKKAVPMYRYSHTHHCTEALLSAIADPSTIQKNKITEQTQFFVKTKRC